LQFAAIFCSLGFLSLSPLFFVSPAIKQNLVEHVFDKFTSPTTATPKVQVQVEPPPNWMPDTPFLKYLHKVQHPANCSTRKFLVYPMPKLKSRDTRNLGAMITALWRWVILAVQDDRTVVIDSTNWNMADCPHNDGSEGGLNCYFEPFSSCDMSHVLEVCLFFAKKPLLLGRSQQEATHSDTSKGTRGAKSVQTTSCGDGAKFLSRPFAKNDL